MKRLLSQKTIATLRSSLIRLKLFAVKTFQKTNFLKAGTELNIHKKVKIQTKLGGVLAIAVFLFILIQGINYSIRMFERENPQIYQINEIEDVPSIISLDEQKNFVLAVVLTKDSEKVKMSKNSPFAFQATLNHHFRHKNGSIAQLRFPIYWAPCNQSDFPQYIFGEAYTTYSLHYGFCITGINYTNANDGSCFIGERLIYPDCLLPPSLVLGGSPVNKEYSFFQLNLTICNPNVDMLAYGLHCNTSSLDADFENSVFEFNIYFANNLINPTTYQIPNKTIIDTFYWRITPTALKISSVYVDRITVQNFNSFLFKSSHQNESHYMIQYAKMRELESVRGSNNSLLLQLTLQRSNINIVIVRTYTKLTDIMVKLGGFSKAIIFIVSVILYGFHRYKYQMVLANELYRFESPIISQKDSNQSFSNSRAKIYILNESGIRDSKDQSIYPISPEHIDDYDIRNYFQSHKTRKLKFYEFQYFYNIFRRCCLCKKSFEEIIAQKARECVLFDLDITKTVQKIQDFEKLKFLLLNYHQRELFDSLEKPLISLSGRKLKHLNTLPHYLRLEIERTSSDQATEDEDDVREEMKQKVLKAREEYDSLSQYAKLYVAYRHLKNDTDLKNKKFNKKLLLLLGQGLNKAFYQMDRLIGKDPVPEKFEKIIKQIMANSG